MTRRLIAAGQRPVTVGMFFSLGHSTIVIITSLIAATGNIDVPAYYVMATCFVSAIAIATLKGDAHRKELRK